MPQTIKNKKELLDLASDFDGFAKKHKWISRYDADSDSLSITRRKLSDDARIRYFDDEMAFYTTKDGRVEGIFIEYFKSNFIEHHRDLRGILRDVKKVDIEDDEEALVELDFHKVEKMAPDLEEAIKLSLAERMNLSLQATR